MKLSSVSILRLTKCAPELQLLAFEAVKESPYEFFITHGYRSITEQQKLYAQGRTVEGKKVTNCDGVKNKSKHNHLPAKAFDIAIKVNGEITWNEKYYKEMGAYFKGIAAKLGIKITWGGDFKNFKDLVHYETN